MARALSLRALCLALFFLCLSSFSAFSRADGTDIPDPDTVVLTADNFDAFIEQDLVLVEFYAPWCGHCKALAPEYAAAASELSRHSPPIPLGKLDATQHGAVASRYGVHGYPTLKVFRNGKESDYKASGATARKTAGIVSYMKKQVGPSVVSLAGEKELDKFVASLDKGNRYGVVGFFNSDKPSQLASSFNVLAPRLREDFPFAKVSDQPALFKQLAQKASQEEPQEEEGLIVFSYGQPLLYGGASKLSAVEEFVKASAIPLVGEINEDNSELYQKQGLPVAKFFMKVDKNFLSKHMKYYLNRFKKLADFYKGKLVVGVADKDAFSSQAEHFNLDKKEEVSLVIEDGGKKYRYDPIDPKKVGKIDVDGWIQWAGRVLDGEEKPYKKSAREPTEQTPVKVLTANNMDALVDDPSKDVLLEFYAPWCGHCKHLEPVYNQLAEKMAKHPDVVVAKLDATANDFDRERFTVNGYPTIFFRPASKAGSSRLAPFEKYEKGRDLEELTAFLKDNARSIKGGKKSKKNKKQAKDEDELDF